MSYVRHAGTHCADCNYSRMQRHGFLIAIKKRDYILPVLASLHWLPIKYRVCFRTLLFEWAPSYCISLIFSTSIPPPETILFFQVQSSKFPAQRKRGSAFFCHWRRLCNSLPLSPLLNTTSGQTHFFDLSLESGLIWLFFQSVVNLIT